MKAFLKKFDSRKLAVIALALAIAVCNERFKLGLSQELVQKIFYGSIAWAGLTAVEDSAEKLKGKKKAKK